MFGVPLDTKKILVMRCPETNAQKVTLLQLWTCLLYYVFWLSSLGTCFNFYLYSRQSKTFT